MLFLSALSLGCAASVPVLPPVIPPPLTRPPSAKLQEPAQVVHSISVEADSTAIPDDLLVRLEAHGTRQRIENELIAQLWSVGRFGEPGEISLVVTVTGFRLRTQTAAENWASLAGTDVVEVGVTVTRGGEESSFSTGASTVLGGPQYRYEAVRLDRVIAELVRRIIAHV